MCGSSAQGLRAGFGLDFIGDNLWDHRLVPCCICLSVLICAAWALTEPCGRPEQGSAHYNPAWLLVLNKYHWAFLSTIPFGSHIISKGNRKRKSPCNRDRKTFPKLQVVRSCPWFQARWERRSFRLKTRGSFWCYNYPWFSFFWTYGRIIIKVSYDLWCDLTNKMWADVTPASSGWKI